jgi:hypothetical protein
MTLQEDFHFDFGLYELNQYVFADQTLHQLKEERDDAIEALYDDISPTVTSVDYETGLAFTQSTHPETMALKIIGEKEKYLALIDKAEQRANSFRLGMESLTDRERDVIQVCYFGRRNDLGLSTSYFHRILKDAQTKLCIFLENERNKRIKDDKKKYLTDLAQRISNWKGY